MLPNAIDTKRVEKSALLYSRGILFDIFPYFAHNIKDKFAYSIEKFFKGERTEKEKIAFLKNEYGTGGQGRSGFNEWHDAKGI
ncbi:hypothetical protein, partial [Ruminococcus sp.]|uniref:hypothetical protein n=1 Tax=Ruminococcus sp. TaxID=41978 RepID=UPI003AF4387E